MNRIKFCICILLAVMLFCIGSLGMIHRQSQKLCDLTAEVKRLSEHEKKDEALVACQELTLFWDSYYKILSVFVKGDKLSELNASVAKIKPFLEEDSEELSAELDSILYQTRWIWETEFPYLHNVF